MEFELRPAIPDDSMRGLWSGLARGASFFLTWRAVSTWLRHQPEAHGTLLLVGREAGRPVLACMLGEASFVRRGVFRGRQLWLNTAGDKGRNLVFMEHNDVLLAPEADADAAFAGMFAYLRRELAWDEFAVPGVTTESRLHRFIEGGAGGMVRELDARQPSPYVDLDAVRGTDRGYLAMLSSNSRRQVRRSLRAYGEPALEAAGTADEALAFFEELVPLHQARWTARGEPGAFGDPRVADFHRDLIGGGFAEGCIQLLRVRSGGATVGVLYNHVQAGCVHFFQGGFAFSEDNRRRPGLMSHYLAVEHNVGAGHRRYDFMAGHARYKSSLATDEIAMAWVRLQRPRLGLAVERGLRKLKARVKGRA